MAPQDSRQRILAAWPSIRLTLFIIGALVLFLFAIDLMVASLQHLGRPAAETIILATSNPFTGLFMGLLITAIIQSSSTTTALVVALVASGAISLESAVPIIMGANIGTTITSTIVSLGFINKKKEFKRAVAAGTYHDFFNILTALVLFPLEYYYGFLSSVASAITSYFSSNGTPAASQSAGFGFNAPVAWLVETMPGVVVMIVAFSLLFGSILLFRKLIADMLLVNSSNRLEPLFFQSPAKAFAWGLGMTAAIRSSTITTSLVVPLVAKKIVRLQAAAPFILGANVGTTVTAFIAAILYTSTKSAITIATVHFLFNFIGVLIFFPVPALRKVPLDLAIFLGKLTLRYRLAGFAYLLSAFFIIPFSLIYLNRESTETMTVLYDNHDATAGNYTSRLLTRINHTTGKGQWVELADTTSERINQVLNFTFRDNVLFVNGTMFMFSKPGYCWDGEDPQGKYKLCIDSVIARYNATSTVSLDSVYVFRQAYDQGNMVRAVYMSPLKPVVLREVWLDSLKEVRSRKLTSIVDE